MTMHISPPPMRELQDLLALWGTQYPKFAALIDQGAPPQKALRYLGLSLWHDGRLDAAAKVLTITAALAPNEPMVLAELGSLLCATGRKNEAMAYLVASLKLNPNQTQVWLTVAGLCNEAGDKDTSEKAFRAALELEPGSAEAAAGLGLLYIERRRFEEAVQLLTTAVEHGVTAMPVYACLGRTLYLLGDFANASAAFEKAARACPDEARIVQTYAQARLIQTMIDGSAEEAIAAYRSAAGRHAEDLTKVCKTAFQVLCGYGRKEAAIRLGEALLEGAPDDPIIRYHLDALHGRALERAPSDYLTACFDKYAPGFDQHIVEVLDYRIPDKLYPMLVETGTTFTRILDLGCGTGLAASRLSSFGGDLTGVDISPRMLDKARERNLYGRLIEDEAIAYLSKHDEQFDLIVSLDVLPYFGDLTALFAATAKRLVPGGVFAFSFETGQHDDYKLSPCGRFAHEPTYVERLAKACFTGIAGLSTTQRLEANRAVAGRLVLLRRV
jgi:predicted TPR repeat methyltransferase